MITSETRAVILAGGELATTPSVSEIDLVVAADSGYDHAMSLSIPVDVLVGDLDSISPHGIAHARENDVEIITHPENKDATDLELAIRLAIDRGSELIDIHGGEGGRVGHLLGIALSLSHSDWASVSIAWHTASGVVRAAIPGRGVHVTVPVGNTVTLVPVGSASGVTTSGLKWPLNGATLERGASIGVSNETTCDQIAVEIMEGAVLVILEGHTRP